MPTKGKKKEKEMVSVKLIAHTNTDPLELTSHAALKCYQAEDPQLGKTIDVKGRLFDVGHHTTLQHSFFTFSIEGIAVGDVTFGLHLTHPFYNSDQRSGRYCAKMFTEPDFGEIEKYIITFWPSVGGSILKKVVEYVKKGVDIYQSNISTATAIAERFIKEERPYVGDQMNAPKIAQEQMRMFIPVIFPTGLDYTINLTVLAAMYRTAWTPAMQYVVGEMVSSVLEKFPKLAFMFESQTESQSYWAIKIPALNLIGIAKKPVHSLHFASGAGFVPPNSSSLHPVDLLHFHPLFMDNAIAEIKTQIQISVATMGQDQRHRTLRRSKPEFIGFFYLPPVPGEMGLHAVAKAYMKQWVDISKSIPQTLAMILAPYGAMVKYDKTGSLNAIAHEQAKRLCWCAQEEIYHVGRALRFAIKKHDELLSIFEPPCYRTGKCAEGARYCGRDLKLRKNGDYFPERKV